MPDQRAIIIGAGIGGIASAIRLAQNGFGVTVVEKCQRAGGRCNIIEKDGHRFDTGPTLFLMPELYQQAFTELGERIEDHVELVRIDPTYQIHFDDDTVLRPTSDLKAMRDQLEAIETGSFGAYLRYLNEGRYHYEQAVPNVVQRPFDHWYQFFTLKNLALMLRLKALKKHFNHITKFFGDERLKIAFTFQNMYVGVNPCEAPAIFSLMQYTELADGVWFPQGGMYSVIEALERIAHKGGVEFIFDTTVEKIVIEDDRAIGVIMERDQRLEGDIILANADLPYVYRQMLPDDSSADRLENKKYGCSALVMLWGLDKQFPQIGPHNLYIAGDFRQSFDALFDGRTIADEPSFYIHAPVRVDPSMAPTGQDTLMIAFPIGHLVGDRSEDWPAIKQHCKDFAIQRLKRLGIKDLEEHIKFEINLTPEYWQNRHNLTKGSAHGLSHDLLQMGYMRPNNRHKRYKNLYFVGASTHPGTGLPTVLVSAKLVSERILREQQAPQSAKVPAPLIA